MKRVLWLCVVLFVLSGCRAPDKNISRVLQFRESLIQSDGCAFRAKIAADYEQQVYHFTVDCKADREGNLSFTLVEPESIVGISGEVRADSGRLIFDNAVLGFPLLADGILAPVSGPWVMLNALRSGYITACSNMESGILVTVNDSYAEDALELNVWVDDQLTPFRGEIFWQGRRVLSLELDKFEIL